MLEAVPGADLRQSRHTVCSVRPQESPPGLGKLNCKSILSHRAQLPVEPKCLGKQIVVQAIETKRIIAQGEHSSPCRELRASALAASWFSPFPGDHSFIHWHSGGQGTRP